MPDDQGPFIDPGTTSDQDDGRGVWGAIADLREKLDTLATTVLGWINEIRQTLFEHRAQIDELLRRPRAVERRVTETTGGSGNAVLVKLSSNATGGGWYNGNLWTAPAAAPSGSSNLTEAMVGTTGAAVVVCNLSEVTKSTHDIKFSGSPTPYQFIFPGVLVTCDDNTTFVAIYVAQWGCG